MKREDMCDECDRRWLIRYRGRRLCSECAVDAIDALADDLDSRYAAHWTVR